MRAPSALAAIGGFGVAAATLGVGVTAGTVLLMPDPPPTRVTVADAATVLRGGEAGGLARFAGPPPAGTRARVLEQVLADALGRPADAVRIVWQGGGRPDRQPAMVFITRQRFDPPIRVPAKVTLRKGPGASRLLSPASASAMLGGWLRTQPQAPFVAAVQGADGRWTGVEPREPFLSGWRLRLLAALAATLMLLGPLAWVFARRLTRPFRALADAVARGRALPPPGGPRELRDAAAAILSLRQRLADEADERLRMLVAVAHDLRTPLTSLKLRIEDVAEPARGRMAADTERMGAMIRDVLAFARAVHAPATPVALRPLVEEVLADLPGAGHDGGAGVTLRPGPDASVRVVEDGLRRAVENLVRNALTYAGGGRVTLVRDGATVALRVEDDGPGIAAADRERLTRPFERGEASRSRDTGGVGLGLSIVRGFAEAHGGTLVLEEAPGGGTAAVLRLPVVAPA